MASELYLMEVGDGRYSILLCDDGSITQMPELTPAETLIAFSELDYAGYRKVVRWLRNEHPLFDRRSSMKTCGRLMPTLRGFAIRQSCRSWKNHGRFGFAA